MRNKRTEGIVILLCGLVCIAAAFYIYFVAHTIYSDPDSSRILGLNRLLNIFGKTGTAFLVAIPGVILIYAAIKKMRRKN